MKRFYIFAAAILIVSTSFAQYASKTDARNKRVSKTTINQNVNKSTKATRASIFTEGFETGDLAGWTVLDEDGDTYNWEAITGATATSTHSGDYNATSASWNSTDGSLTPENWLISPAIDLSSTTGTIMVNYWVMGQDQSWPSEHYKLVVSTTDISVASFTDNIYEETITAGPEADNYYLEKAVNLSVYAGETIYLAWVHYDCTNNFRLNLDDIEVYTNETIDAAITSITSPNHTGGCTLAVENVTITIANNGGSDITGFDVSYAIDGGTPVVETVSETITPAATLEYTFTQTADLSTLGNYNIVATVALTDDSDATNDTKSIDITNGDTEITIHAMTDDGAGQSWQIVNNLTSEIVAERTIGWQWNVEVTETVCVIDANCYNVVVSDEDGNGMVDGTAYLEILYDGTQVAGSTTPDSWSTATLTAENLGSGCLATDAGVTEISEIQSGCGLGMEDITITIKNFGTSDITDVPVVYIITGETAVSETATGTIAAGETLSYTFTAQVDLSALGEYEISAYTVLVDDGNLNNDTAMINTINVTPSTIPYLSELQTEADLLGWSIEDVNADGSTWGLSADVGVDGSVCATASYNATNASDDYIYTTCLNLVAGTGYKLTFQYAAKNATYPENLNVYIGSDQISTAMTTQLVDIAGFTNTTFEEGSAFFTVSTDGVYFIGFHAYSDADMYAILLDNVNIDFGNEINNNAVSEISIYPNPANNVVNIANAENSSITVINMVGQVVSSTVANSNLVSINTSNLSEGTYLVRITNGNEVTTQKINVIR